MSAALLSLLDLLAEMDPGTYVDLHDYDGRKLAAVELWAKSRNVDIERRRLSDGSEHIVVRLATRMTVTVHDMRTRHDGAAWRPADEQGVSV